MTFAIGERVRFVEPSHPRRGDVVVIRGYQALPMPDGEPALVEPWPYFTEAGENWPINPAWVEPTTRPATSDAEQLPLFAGVTFYPTL